MATQKKRGPGRPRKLTPLQEHNVYRSYIAKTATSGVLAVRYNVTDSTILNIVKRKSASLAAK